MSCTYRIVEVRQQHMMAEATVRDVARVVRDQPDPAVRQMMVDLLRHIQHTPRDEHCDYHLRINYQETVV